MGYDILGYIYIYIIEKQNMTLFSLVIDIYIQIHLTSTIIQTYNKLLF